MQYFKVLFIILMEQCSGSGVKEITFEGQNDASSTEDAAHYSKYDSVIVEDASLKPRKYTMGSLKGRNMRKIDFVIADEIKRLYGLEVYAPDERYGVWGFDRGENLEIPMTDTVYAIFFASRHFSGYIIYLE